MSMVSVQEIKRRGISAVDDLLENGPVHLIKSNQAKYVVMSEVGYHDMMNDLTEARLIASESDIRAGRISRGNVSNLMRELIDD